MINYSGNKITLRSIICIVLIINISCNNSNPKKDYHMNFGEDAKNLKGANNPKNK